MKYLQEREKKFSLETNLGFDELFEKLASDLSFSSYEDYKHQVTNIFNDDPRVVKNLERWEDKLSLDKNKLQEVFKK